MVNYSFSKSVKSVFFFFFKEAKFFLSSLLFFLPLLSSRPPSPLLCFRWDGDWVGGGAKTQLPCPSLGVVGGTQPELVFRKQISGHFYTFA